MQHAVTSWFGGETVGVAVAEDSERRAGYYVSTQDRPAFVSELSTDDFDAVFGLMRQDLDDRSTQANGNGHKGSGSASDSPRVAIHQG